MPLAGHGGFVRHGACPRRPVTRGQDFRGAPPEFCYRFQRHPEPIEDREVDLCEPGSYTVED